ncbi:MAG: peptidase M14, partial [Aggregatilineales bacterium]
MADLKVGTAIAAPGTRAQGVIPVTTLPGGRSLDIPVIVLNGAEDGHCVWVDAVIHGDEPEGTLCCHML